MASNFRVATYNLLSPNLSSHQYFKHCTKKQVEGKHRIKLIKEILNKEAGQETVLCLQEVSYSWASELQVFFSALGYNFIHTNYGYDLNGYMGVGIAYPDKKFRLVDCDISRLSDTKQGGYFPQKGDLKNLYNTENVVAKRGVFSKALRYISTPVWAIFYGCRRMYRALTFWKPPAKPDDVWKNAKKRTNTLVALRLQDRQFDESGEEGVFAVGTYHMPCAYYLPPLMGIHSCMLLRRMNKAAKNSPFILAGDFNITPGSPCYELITTGKVKDKERKASITPPPAYIGDSWELGVSRPLKSAFVEVNGKEPSFTNKAMVGTQDESFVDTIDYIFYYAPADKLTPTEVDDLPDRESFESVKSFPTDEYPSDHILIGSKFTITP